MTKDTMTKDTHYPQWVREVEGRAGRWYVSVDRWDSPTSHEGRRRELGPYRTAARAHQAISDMLAEQEG